MKKTYGTKLPNINYHELIGKLFVIEGPDSSGRSTQVEKLHAWLEGKGYAVKILNLARSALIGPELVQAREGNVLSPTTRSLFYATDFAHQMVTKIIPALRAGFIVLSDRYIYTLMARELVRGANPAWVRNLYSWAIIPDKVFFLKVQPHNLIQRAFQKNGVLDYWESGMDLGLSRDMFESFLIYQEKMSQIFDQLQKEYGFIIVNGDLKPKKIHKDIRALMKKELEKSVL